MGLRAKSTIEEDLSQMIKFFIEKFFIENKHYSWLSNHNKGKPNVLSAGEDGEVLTLGKVDERS